MVLADLRCLFAASSVPQRSQSNDNTRPRRGATRGFNTYGGQYRSSRPRVQLPRTLRDDNFNVARNVCDGFEFLGVADQSSHAVLRMRLGQGMKHLAYDIASCTCAVITNVCCVSFSHGSYSLRQWELETVRTERSLPLCVCVLSAFSLFLNGPDQDRDYRKHPTFMNHEVQDQQERHYRVSLLL